jgi:hypothetical protein
MQMAIYRPTFVLLVTVILSTFATAVAQVSAPPADSTEARIIKFDVSGAGTAAGQGTMPIGIVQGGWLMGEYIDASDVSHAFLRAPNGKITKFDAPGAGTGAGQGTVDVWGMNPALEIVGTYLDSNNLYHCFLRSPDGTFTTIDAPGASTGAFQGTECESVNSAGVIQGDYADANSTYHGFVRTRDGTFTTFDAPGVPTGVAQGIYPAIFSGINPQGATVGGFLDSNYVIHGYLRAADGSITQIDNPNAGPNSFQGTFITGINPEGEINGFYIDANAVYHGFLLARHGAVTPVDVPGSGTGTNQGTDASPFISAFGGINPAGTITGFYVDQNSTYHGYLRTAHGHIVTFDVAGATTGNFQGTLPLNINPEGEVTGWYVDPNGQNHGFVRIPYPLCQSGLRD